MTPEELRLECLRLAAAGASVAVVTPGEGTRAPISALDVATTAAIIERARGYAEFVLGCQGGDGGGAS